MRVPLKVQLVLPLVAVTIVTCAALAAYQAREAARRVDERISRQVAGVGQTLAESSFPLTANVLQQMRDLSGAEFVVVRRDRPATATLELSAAAREALAMRTDAEVFRLGEPLVLDGASYFHARLPTNRLRPDDVVHVLYPRDDYREAIAAAVGPPIALGLAAVVAATLAGWWTAVRVSRAVESVGDRLERIAAGDFASGPAPRRNDELGDLEHGVNRTASQLADYAERLRRAEQLRTLGQLSAGLAHEIRNAATGARLAVQHHQAEHAGTGAGDEPLAVANRQLQLIEEYVQRFLRLGRSAPESERRPTDLARLAAEGVELAAPYAAHLGVRLRWEEPAARATEAVLDAIPVRQAIDNLLRNGIDAAVAGPPPAEVTTGVLCRGDHVVVIVSDTGLGPAAEVAERMFEPLVTDKPDGAGLGLALARQAADQHNGTLTWRRHAGRTEFTLALPARAE
ncbi:MAG: HAMP domain-containing histidine kinase [Pirellulales bacterium]|nr:HAMP domain-containing histidine kinase [Pirellulales bacterium]